MAKGINLAGGYGAGGVRDALVDLIVQKQVAEDRAIAAQQRDMLQKRQAMLDAQAAEDRTFNRGRLTQQDERTARMDTELREDKDAKQAIEMATLFPGKVVSGETMKRVPKYLHELIAKPKDEQLASRSVGGVAVAGKPNEGAIDIEAHEAVGPDSFELQLPESERKRIADTRAAAAAEKGERDETYRRDKLDADTKHRETMAMLAQTRAANAAGRTREMTPNQQFNAISSLGRAYQTNTKAAREIQRQYGVMEQGLAAMARGDKTNGEQAVVMSFNKILDPDSVVREGEYDRTQQGQALIQRMEALAGRVTQGGVIAPDVLKNMATLAKTYRDRAVEFQQQEQKRIKAQAEHWDLPSELIFTDRAEAPASGAPSAGTPTPTERYVPGQGLVKIGGK